jgi:hypothetical protein
MHGGFLVTRLQISKEQLQKSLLILSQSIDREKVILWLGKKQGDSYVVKEVFTPLQYGEEDFFVIPPKGMEELMSRLKKTRCLLLAQVHTHPGHAYHSEADDEWAIVRHQNAFSLVLPYFCSTTFVGNFLQDVATYLLNGNNQWIAVDNNYVDII